MTPKIANIIRSLNIALEAVAFHIADLEDALERGQDQKSAPPDAFNDDGLPITNIILAPPPEPI
jgi:hypothetical protein